MSRRRPYPQLADAAWLRGQYAAKRRSARDIAIELGCSRQAVTNALRAHDIAVRPGGRPPAVRDERT